MANNEKIAAPQEADPLAWDRQLLADPHTVTDKRKRVQNMFAAIAPSYDLNNRLHSLWLDQAWRRKAVKLAQLKPTDRVVDVACGTGDLTIQFANSLWWKCSDRAPSPLPLREQVVGIDFTFDMLPMAQKKGIAKRAPIRSNPPLSLGKCIKWINGDAQSLPLQDQNADVLSIAFGIRNVQEPAKALAEFRRVLRPGGRLIILEFSLPTNPILRALYNFYFHQILPRTATLISGDKTGAYKYLPQSVNSFISRDKMVAMMADAGFEKIEQFPMTFGVCICYRGVAPD